MPTTCANCSVLLPKRLLWSHFCSAVCFRVADGIPKPVDRIHSLKTILDLLTGKTKSELKQLIHKCVQSDGGDPLLFPLLSALTHPIDGGALVNVVAPGWKLDMLRALTAGEVTSDSLMLLRAILRDESIKNNPAAIRLAIELFSQTAKIHPQGACSAIFNAISTVSNKDLAAGNPALVECLWRMLETGSKSAANHGVAGRAAAVLGRLAAGVGASGRIDRMMRGLDKLMELAIGLSPEGVSPEGVSPDGVSHLFADLGLVARNFAMKLEVEHMFALNPQFVACLFSRAIHDHDLEPGSEALCALINIGMNPKVREYFEANLDAAAFGKIALIIMRHARRPDSLIKWVRFLSNLFGVKVSSGPLALRLRACAPMVLPEAVISAPPSDARVCASGYELPNFGPAPDLGAILRAIEELIAALAHTPDVRDVLRMATTLTYTVHCFDDALGMELMRQLGDAAERGGAAHSIDADLQMSIRDCAEGKLNPASLLRLLGTKPVVVERAVRWPDVYKALEDCRNLADVLLKILELNIESTPFASATPADDVVFAQPNDFDRLDASAQCADGLPLTAPRPGGLGPVQPTQRAEVLKWIMHALNMLTSDCRGAEAAPLRVCRVGFKLAAATIGCAGNGQNVLTPTLMTIFVTPLQPSARQRKLAERMVERKR